MMQEEARMGQRVGAMHQQRGESQAMAFDERRG